MEMENMFFNNYISSIYLSKLKNINHSILIREIKKINNTTDFLIKNFQGNIFFLISEKGKSLLSNLFNDLTNYETQSRLQAD